MTTPAFRLALERTANFEGGYSDQKNDRGGKTKYGITEKTWAEYHKPLVPPKPVSEITKLESEAVFWKLYWVDPMLDELDEAHIAQFILNAVFDAGVHHGQGTAVKMLQRSYNAVRYDDSPMLTEDGKIGPRTVGALVKFLFKPENEGALLGAYAVERGRYMAADIAKNPSQRQWVRGWYRRLLP